MSSPAALLAALHAITATIHDATTASTLSHARATLVATGRELDMLAADLAAAQDALREAGAALKDKRRQLETDVTPPVAANHLDASTYLEKTWTALRRGEYDKAVAAAEVAVQLNATDPDGYAYLGWSLALSSDADEASRAAQQALLLNPTHAMAIMVQGIVATQRDLVGEAIEHLRRVRDRQGRVGGFARLYLGTVYLKRNMFSDAAEILERALERAPNLLEARYYLGVALRKLGRADAAHQAWQIGASASGISPWARRCAEAAGALSRPGPATA